MFNLLGTVVYTSFERRQRVFFMNIFYVKMYILPQNRYWLDQKDVAAIW